MEKKRTFQCVKFSQQIIQKAWECLNRNQEKVVHTQYHVQLEDDEWHHDSESEFFSDYIKNCHGAFFVKRAGDKQIYLQFLRGTTYISVMASNRTMIEEVQQIFENSAEACRLPEIAEPPEEPPIVFVGHGQSSQWRDLKDHLHDKHGYRIEAYEVGSRAGHAIRDILEEMLSKSSIAILVMTGEDKDNDGNLHARDNVIHELGLFQGRLGFSKAIVLLEAGTQEFSNISGIHQIRYSRGNIKETYGEVLATLRREMTIRESIGEYRERKK